MSVFSFLRPLDFTFQFSGDCLAESFERPAREEKLQHINYSSGMEGCLDHDSEEAYGLKMSKWVPIENRKILYTFFIISIM